MRIDRVDLYHFAAPLPATFYPSWIPGYPQRENRATLCRIVTDDGIEGWAAGAAFGRERKGLGEILGPYLIGMDPRDIPTVQQRLKEMSYLGWFNHWLEVACWDVIGKAENKPIYALHGGKPGRIKLYASTGEVKGPAERVEEVERLWAEGFRAVKLRVHAPTLAEDVAQVEAVARAFQGRPLRIGVDANQAWLVDAMAKAPRWSFDRALEFSRACEDLGVDWLEEPLDMDDFAALARLRKATTIDIAGAEIHSRGVPEVMHMIDRGCYDMYQPDATFVGGISGCIKIMHRCTAEGLRYTPHTWTNGLGFAANLQVFGAYARRDEEYLEYPLAPPGWVPAARDAMLSSPLLAAPDGTLELPTAPGLGVSMDEGAIAKYAKRFYTATKLRVAVQVIRDKGLKTAIELGRVKKAREAEARAVAEARA